MAPPERPGKIVCVGRNYRDHAAELGNRVPERPLLFLKPPSAVIGDGEAIRLPSESRQVEHEGELGVVVGGLLRDASEEEAARAVAGVTCVNDVTARDLQRTDGQWTRAKGFDTFCPVGPRVVPMDELPGGWEELHLRCRVNGELRQEARVGEMVFSPFHLLAYVSRIMTLEPGDLLATGTPAGVGPLTAGDEVTVEIEGVGILRNPVVPREG